MKFAKYYAGSETKIHALSVGVLNKNCFPRSVTSVSSC